MPVSKRDKKVSLTKTTKKGLKMKEKVIEDIRENLDIFNNLFVFTVHNMRNGPLTKAREEWSGKGRFFLAKRRLMGIALGTSAEKEIKKNLHKVSALLFGECGIFLTNKSKDEVVQWFDNFRKMDYARSGFEATETVVLPVGPLAEFAPAIEPHLRNLGMPTKLEKGVVVLREKFTVCTKGSVLTPNQANILKLLKKEMAEFKMTIICVWSKDGTFEKFAACNELKKAVKSPKPVQKAKASAEPVIKTELMDVEEESDEDDDDESEDNEVLTQKKEKITITPKQEKKSPKQQNNTPKQQNNTPKQENKTPKQQNNTPKQENKTPNQQNKTPKQQNNTPKQEDKTPKQQNKTPKSEKKTPQQTQKSPTKQSKTPSKAEVEESESQIETQSEIDELESMQIEEEPKTGRANTRRSMRTPKPIKRTPEQRRMSIKKLTESAKSKATPTKAKATPKRAAK